MAMGLLLLSLCVLTVGSVLSLLPLSFGRRVSFLGAGISVFGAILAVVPAIWILFTGESAGLKIPWAIPFGTFNMAADPLSALFIIIISVICAVAAVYGVGYLNTYYGKKHLGGAWCFYNLLFAGMLLIVLARNGLLFLMAWETMSLASFFLVMFEHEKSTVRHAGWMYLSAAHLGAACLLALFAFLGGPGIEMDFDHLIAPSAPWPQAFFLSWPCWGSVPRQDFFHCTSGCLKRILWPPRMFRR